MSRIKILEVVAGVLVLAGIVFYFNSGGGCTSETLRRTVEGDSMQGIFDRGVRVRIAVGYYGCHAVERGDIVAYQYGGSETPIIKRVVAVPGDTWSVERVEEGKEMYAIFVNEKEQATTLGSPYRIGPTQAKMLSLYASPVGKDSYMILGNLPGGTEDSTRFGLVGVKDIVGKVL